MKKIFLLAILAVTISIGTVNAQSKSANSPDYTTALGLRLGYPFGVSLKHFVSPAGALEGIVGFWYGGINVTGLYEYHMPISGVDGLKWFVGGGLDFTSWSYGGYSGGSVAIDGIIGLDYKVNTAPVDISLDWKPSFYITGVKGFYGTGAAISVRYTF